MPSSMSSSERFDVATGILSVVILCCALLERALPWTRYQVLEKCLKRTEANLDDMCEEGLLGEQFNVYVNRLARLRRESDELAVRVHAAGNIYRQVVEMLKGLSCSLMSVNRRVAAIQAEMATCRSAAYRQAQQATSQKQPRSRQASSARQEGGRPRHSPIAARRRSSSRGRVVASTRALTSPTARIAITGFTRIMERSAMPSRPRSRGGRSSSVPGILSTHSSGSNAGLSRIKSSVTIPSQAGQST